MVYKYVTMCEESLAMRIFNRGNRYVKNHPGGDGPDTGYWAVYEYLRGAGLSAELAVVKAHEACSGR